MFSLCDCNARRTPLSLLGLAIGQTIKSATTAARPDLIRLSWSLSTNAIDSSSRKHSVSSSDWLLPIWRAFSWFLAYDQQYNPYHITRHDSCQCLVYSFIKSKPRATESSSSHLIVAASVTLTKLNRALLTGVRQARLRQATTRIASACNQLSNAYVRLVGSCFYDWFFQVYANNYGWSF